MGSGSSAGSADNAQAHARLGALQNAGGGLVGRRHEPIVATPSRVTSPMRHYRVAVMRHDSVMRAELKNLWLEPDAATLSGNPAAFALNARLMIGPGDGPDEELFDVTICTPEWLSVAARGGFYDARHHVVVDFEAFDQAELHRWLARRVETVQADKWKQIGERLSRLGYWEFEDY